MELHGDARCDSITMYNLWPYHETMDAHVRYTAITYIAITTQEVRYELPVDVSRQAAAALIILATVNQKLPRRILVNKRTDQRPEHRKHARRTHNQQPTHRFRVVRLDALDDAQEHADAGSPQVAHAQCVQVHNARAAADWSAELVGRLAAATQSLLVHVHHLKQRARC